jgi:DNA-binding LytR/AlgR family response regulator
MRKIIIPIANDDLIIKTDEVSHLSAKGDRYCWLVMISGKQKLLHIPLIDILKILPMPPFYQVHREHIVHIERIKKVMSGDKMRLEMFAGQIIPLSKDSVNVLLKQ